MKTIKIKLDNQTVEIKKLPIGKYAELLKALKEIPKKISGMPSMDNDQMLENLPLIFSESLPEALNILSIATPLTIEQLNELGLDECVKIALAVYEVNNYKEIYEQIKKAIAQPNAPKLTTTATT